MTPCAPRFPWTRVLACLALVPVASCHQCSGPPPVPPLAAITIPPPPGPTAVVVSPATATLFPGSSLMFTAQVTFSDGSVGGGNVTWAVTGGSITLSGLYTAGGAAGNFRVIAKAGDVADTSTVTVVAAATGGLTVAVTGVPATQAKWLLQDTDSLKSTCPSDLVTRFATAELPVANIWPGCPTELSAFAKGWAPVLDVAPAPVTTGAKSVITEPLPAAWIVKLRVIYEYAKGDSAAVAGLDLAAELLDANAMGITLLIADGPDLLSPDIDPATGAVHRFPLAIKMGCAAVAAEPGLVSPDRLNVYLVREDQWIPGWGAYYGFNCFESGSPNIIFLREKHVPETLVHEIGHALSLRHAGWGFNLGYYGWTDDNLMQDSAFDPDAPRPIDHFSLGQAYRANFHQDSWLMRGSIRTGAWKSCQSADRPGNSGLDWQCPDIRLDWP